MKCIVKGCVNPVDPDSNVHKDVEDCTMWNPHDPEDKWKCDEPEVHHKFQSEPDLKYEIGLILTGSDIVWERYGIEKIPDLAERIIEKVKEYDGK